MSETDENGFTIVDRRKANDEASHDHLPEAEKPETPAETSEEFPPDTEEKSGLSARDHLTTCLEILHQGAWMSMGLVADPTNGEIRVDLNGARDAIDCAVYIAEKLEYYLDESGKREIRNLITDLRMNYAYQMNR